MSGEPEACQHSWKFWGDDPYVICAWCEELRDALTDRVIRAGKRRTDGVQP